MYNGKFFLQPTDAILSRNSPSIYGSAFANNLYMQWGKFNISTSLFIDAVSSRAEVKIEQSLSISPLRVFSNSHFDVVHSAMRPYQYHTIFKVAFESQILSLSISGVFKGQKISKTNYGVLNSPQNQTKDHYSRQRLFRKYSEQ